MNKYLITPTLYNSWYYYMKSEQTLEDFLKILSKEPFEKTEAILKGLNFEEAIYEIDTVGLTNKVDKSELECAKEIANIINNGYWQQSASKKIENFVLYGKADVIKGNHIYDIKRVSSYELGKYEDSIQHKLYMEIFDISNFTYLICDGNNIYKEYYSRKNDNLDDILSKVKEMLNWFIQTPQLFSVFDDNWQSKY